MTELSGFCDALGEGKHRRQRCVAGYGHAGKHDFQPMTSAVVVTVTRQEEAQRRLGYGPVEVRATEKLPSQDS